MLNVYVLLRKDNVDWDEYDEQTIVASSEERAIELACKEYGEWYVDRVVDLNKEQILTTSFCAG